MSVKNTNNRRAMVPIYLHRIEEVKIHCTFQRIRDFVKVKGKDKALVVPSNMLGHPHSNLKTLGKKHKED